MGRDLTGRCKSNMGCFRGWDCGNVEEGRLYGERCLFPRVRIGRAAGMNIQIKLFDIHFGCSRNSLPSNLWVRGSGAALEHFMRSKIDRYWSTDLVLSVACVCLFLPLALYPITSVGAHGNTPGRVLRRLETEQKHGTYNPASLNCPPRGACVTLIMHNQNVWVAVFSESEEHAMTFAKRKHELALGVSVTPSPWCVVIVVLLLSQRVVLSTRVLALNIITSFSDHASHQLGYTLPELVPALTPCIGDTKKQVKTTAVPAMTAASGFPDDIFPASQALLWLITTPRE